MRRRQWGQVLPLGVLLLAVAGLAWVHGHQLRQVANARMRMSHVADAVAYSGALVQARALNMLAWTSRAQLAHQVAMAHVATLAAWAGFGATQAAQAATGNPPVYLIAALFGADHGASYAAAIPAGPVAEASRPGWLGDYARHDAVIHDVLERVRRDTLAGMAESRNAAMHAVFEENLRGNFSGLAVDATRVRGSLAGQDAGGAPALSVLSDDFSGAVRSQAAVGGAGTQRWLAQRVQQTPFLSPRNHTVRNSYLVSPYCPHLRHELRRRGRTQLDDAGHWQALDTLSFHALRANRWVGCYFRPYPMGWAWAVDGSAELGESHVDAPPRQFAAQAFWRWLQASTNWSLLSTDNALATSYAKADAMTLTGRGLSAELRPAADEFRFAIGLSVPAHMLSTNDAAGISRSLGIWRFAGLGAGGRLRVVSAAGTEYVRPQARLDGALESANLYLPYWQARLHQPEAQWRRPVEGAW